MSDHTSVAMTTIPPCDLCDNGTPAAYDAALAGVGSWAYVCERHFRMYGVGLGLGRGQRLVERGKP